MEQNLELHEPAGMEQQREVQEFKNRLRKWEQRQTLRKFARRCKK